MACKDLSATHNSCSGSSSLLSRRKRNLQPLSLSFLKFCRGLVNPTNTLSSTHLLIFREDFLSSSNGVTGTEVVSSALTKQNTFAF